MYKKLVLFLGLLCGFTFAQAQTLQEAEKNFQDEDFTAAKNQYEQVLKTTAGDEKYQIQLRLAACQYHLGEFLNAAKTIYAYELPAAPVWKARFLLYRTFLAKNASSRYRRISNEYEIDTPQAKADLEQWTQKQWNEQIEKDFRQLWELRSDLINAPIEQETLILNVKDTDTRRIPTLFDFVVQQRLNSLPYDKKEDRKEILKTAYTLDGTHRENAKIFWQTDFILLPLENPSKNSKNTEETVAAVVEQLNRLSGFTAQEPAGWWQRVKNYFNPPSQPDTSYARSYTALKTAQLLEENKRAPQALEVCAYADTLPSSHFTKECSNLVQQIHRVWLEAKLPGNAVNRQNAQLEFSGKNLHTLYTNIYATSLNELKQIYAKNNKNPLHSWQDLFSLYGDELENFLKKSPLYTLTQEVVYQGVAQEQKGTIQLPPLEPGIYVVAVSASKNFNPKKDSLQMVLLNATDLALFATAGIEGNPADFTVLQNSKSAARYPNVFHLYGVNLKTGEPVGNLPVELITDWNGTREKTLLQADATVDVQREILGGEHSSSGQIDAFARMGNSVAYTNKLYWHYNPADAVILTAQTDRAIYRPGQEVQIAVQGFERQIRGWKTLANPTVQITVKDPNWKKIFTANITLNKLGAGQTVFTLPQEGLLGNYRLEASYQRYSASHSFKVEEFKQPDYEITLNAPEKPLEFGKSGKITGKAAYYFGAPLAKAKVVYTITRQAYHPPFYWWYWRPVYNTEVIAQGETKTDNAGDFSVSFTPAPAQQDDEFAQFVLKTEVYDESGRPIETTRSYHISQHPHLFKVDFAQGFYDENQETALANMDLTDADGNSTTGKIHLKAQLLENKLPKTGANDDEEIFRNFYPAAPSLEQLYKDAAVQKTAFEKAVTFAAPGAQEVRLPALPQGVYRLEISGDKAATQQLIFIVTGKNSTLQLPQLTLVQHKTYYPGETLRVLLGAGALTGSNRVEVYQENQFLIHKEKLPGGVQIFEFPVTQTMRGGLALRWFGASNYQFYSGTSSVEVPFDNKQLAVKLDVPATQKPGEQTLWKLTAKNAFGAPVNGQANITVYDKSLDYYQKPVLPLTFNRLFPQQNGVPSTASSARTNYFTGWNPSAEGIRTDELPLPRLNLYMSVRSYGSFGRGEQKMMAVRSAAAPQAAMLKEAKADFAANEEAANLSESLSVAGAQNAVAANGTAETDTGSSQQPDTSVRTEFAQTAYFNAALPMTNGQARVQFKLPQTLTTWNILGFVLTQAADFGDFSAQLITRKDFMTRLTLPRFYREGDKGTLQAAVTNQTDRKITAQVTLSVTRNNQTALAAWGIQNAVKRVTVAPNSTQFVSWDVTAPFAPDLYQITAVARSGKESDGEQRELPVFPSKQRLVAAAHTALKNGTNTLTLPELAHVPAADVELTSLTINPSLALSVLNDMPGLLTTPYKDLVSSLNRYVPLAVVNQFYNTYPQLKEAVKKLPKRSGLTPAWEENNPLRLELLASTPWLSQAQGRQIHEANIINLFDDKNVAKLLEKELATIARFQNASGAFTWFAGGPDDKYLTLYALEAFAQALNYQAKIPQKEAQKAFRFIVPEIEKILKEDKDGSVGTVSFALYAAYTLSSFPQTWPQYAAAKSHLKNWVDYADKYSKFMTPLGRIYAAAVYHRLGENEKANRYLDLVLSAMKEDPLTGAYFAPEPQSWLWYNDTLTTQTVTLRTLLEIRPNAKQIDSMTQWLLFNRQVNDWTNSKAAAQAVFTLLDVMKAKGALSSPTRYSFRWGNRTQNITFEPFDWTEDLQFTHTSAQISPNDYQVTITKQGNMTDFASLNAVYRASDVTASPKGVLNVSRQYFRRVKEGTETKLVPVENLENVQVGDEIEVHLTLETDSAFEYVQVKDPKPAGFESADLLSRWDYQPIRFYKEVRDANTNFFVSWLPHGKVTLRYVLRPTVPGQFHAAAAQAQSMYAPEYAAHTESGEIRVEK